MAERSSPLDSSFGVSDQQCVGSSPDLVLTLVSLSKALKHLNASIGHKAIGPVCCAMHIKEPSYTYHKEKGFAPVFLAVAAECTAAPCNTIRRVS